MRGWLRRRRLLEPQGRPIEEIADHLWRLCAQYHGFDPRTPFVKVEAVRRAYDHVLGECCTALGGAHLLGVLRPGPELDAERERVEDLLMDFGLRLPHVA